MDIVEQLRKDEPTWAMDMGQANALVLCHKAADEIERLRADLDRMASLAIDNAKDTGRAIKYRGALHSIGYGPPHEGEPLDLLNKFVDLARYALKEED